jgi:hypothetical protein
MSDSPIAQANEDEQRKAAVPDWLDKLQTESWQAEILISGGAFVGLGSVSNAFVPIFQFLFYSTSFSERLINFLAFSVDLVVWSLMFGFLIHLVLRGFWIGLIGMNYVFPKGMIKERLALKGKFKNMFHESQNTPLIIRLDKYCSAIFAVTFVWLFSGIGINIYISGLTFLTDESVRAGHPWVNLISIFVLLVGFTTLIDFLSAGRLKRIKWLSAIYYPFHKVMSFITLSFIYRRLYYTVVSNINWRSAMLLFSIPFFLIFGIVILSNLSSDLSDSFDDIHGGYVNKANPSFLTINDPIIYENSLEVNLIHINRLEREAFVQWKKKNRGNLTTDFRELDPRLQLAILSELYQIEVDGKKLDDSVRWMITRPRNTEGRLFPRINLATVLDISNLQEGQHQLAVTIKLGSVVLLNQKAFNGRYARVNFYFHKPLVAGFK